MSDAVMLQILQQLPQLEHPILFLADDGFDQALITQLQSFSQTKTLHVLSNRFDVYQHAKNQGVSAQFNDWQLAETPAIKTIILRVCKERAVTQHLIHSAAKKLPHEGSLILLGKKNEGIKTYCKFADEIFKHNTRPQKSGDVYRAQFMKTNTIAPFESDNYTELRETLSLDGSSVFSKPGLYGWDKIDEGSLLLVQNVKRFCKEKTLNFKRALDLGCGYGYLSLSCHHLSERWVATDTNAAALAAMEKNAKHWQLNLEAKPSDCADTLTGAFDLILCNPPFHKGFATSGDLTELFIGRAKEKLSADGLAFFVVNSFIPIEKYANRYFDVDLMENNKKFKVLKLRKL